ncbi:MAG: very short patch repair endonuclease [Halioglobus sp.]
MAERPHMRKVKSKNTAPELRLRRILLESGYRGYRVHYEKLQGKPDVVFTKRRKVIFVHGCFWHGHSCRAGRNTPKSNQGYWEPKLLRNKERDKMRRRSIRNDGWEVLTLWECQLKDVDQVARRLAKFMGE